MFTSLTFTPLHTGGADGSDVQQTLSLWDREGKVQQCSVITRRVVTISGCTGSDSYLEKP